MIKIITSVNYNRRLHRMMYTHYAVGKCASWRQIGSNVAHRNRNRHRKQPFWVGDQRCVTRWTGWRHWNLKLTNALDSELNLCDSQTWWWARTDAEETGGLNALVGGVLLHCSMAFRRSESQRFSINSSTDRFRCGNSCDNMSSAFCDTGTFVLESEKRKGKGCSRIMRKLFSQINLFITH